MALIGKYESSAKSKEDKKTKDEQKTETPIKKDNWIESELIRPLAAKKSSEMVFNLFNTYKKAHGMASYV